MECLLVPSVSFAAPLFPRRGLILSSTVEIITCIFWLSTFSLLVWECMNGDATFAILGESGVSDIVAYVTAMKVKAAIIGLKVATGLSCVNWIAFAVTFIIASMC